VTLSCEYSLPGVLYHWRRGRESLRAGDKYVMRHKKTTIFLTINALRPQDTGYYSCHCREHYTTASLNVIGKEGLIYSDIQLLYSSSIFIHKNIALKSTLNIQAYIDLGHDIN